MKQHFRAIKRVIPIFEVTAVSVTNQPTNDDIQVLSDNAADVQKVTIYGYDNADVLQFKELTLTGTTAVDSVIDPKWKIFLGAFLGDIKGNISARATGTITIREKTGGQPIATIAAGKLSTGTVFFYVPGEDIVIENISGNTWFNTKGVASTTGANGQLSGRMDFPVLVEQEYVSLVSDNTGSIAQIYVLET
jgi:hypothetical protein